MTRQREGTNKTAKRADIFKTIMNTQTNCIEVTTEAAEEYQYRT